MFRSSIIEMVVFFRLDFLRILQYGNVCAQQIVVQMSSTY